MSQTLKSVLKIPGSFGLPYLGEARQLFSQQELFYWHHFQQYNSEFKTRILGRNLICLVGTEANELVLKDQGKMFSSAMGWSFLKSFLGEGLLLEDGKEHQVTRKLLNSAFNHQQVPTYFEKLKKWVEDYIFRYWEGRSIDLFPELRKLNLLLLCQLLIGEQPEEEIELICQNFLSLITGIRTIIRLNIPGSKFGKAQQSSLLLRNKFQAIIQQRRLNKFNYSQQDILDCLLNLPTGSGKDLSDVEISNHLLHFLFAGYQTTGKLVGWSLFELNNHRGWLKKLEQEQLTIMGQNSLEINHLKNFTCLKYVLKEIERLYPPTYTIFRGVVNDFEYRGYLIPKGWYVVVSPLLTHRLNHLYTDPHQFDPNRFSPSRQEDKKHPFALIGFGGGTHQCLGSELALMKAKIILSTILRNYQWIIECNFSGHSPIFPTNKAEKMMKAKFQTLP